MQYTIDGRDVTVLDAHGAVKVDVYAVWVFLRITYGKFSVSQVSQLQLTVVLRGEGVRLVAVIVATVYDAAVGNYLSDGVAYLVVLKSVP